MRRVASSRSRPPPTDTGTSDAETENALIAISCARRVKSSSPWPNSTVRDYFHRGSLPGSVDILNSYARFIYRITVPSTSIP